MKVFIPIGSAVEEAAREGLKDSGRAILKRGRELSPTLSGESDKSGFSNVDDLTLQVGFKSYISRIQHEDLDYQHKPGEQAKFLEAAAEEIDTGAIIATEVRGTFG